MTAKIKAAICKFKKISIAEPSGSKLQTIFLFQLLVVFSLINQSFKKELHSQVLRLHSICHPDKAHFAAVVDLLASSFFIAFRPGASFSGTLHFSYPCFSVTPSTEVQQGDSQTQTSGKAILEHWRGYTCLHLVVRIGRQC